MKEINRIVHDERTYIESIGKSDKETVRAALSDKGADTVLRVCFGMTGDAMPIRALSYYASALAVQEHYFPEAELQFVYPYRAAYMANGVSIVASQEHARTADTEAKRIFARRFRTDHAEGGQVKSFYDCDLPTEDLVAGVAEVLAAQPDLGSAFVRKARNGNYPYYVAAHLLMHDTNPQFLPCEPLDGGAFADSGRGRIISIGAQSERPFYLARMACRQAQLVSPYDQVETGQLFTRHVLPPYISTRYGEEPELGTQSFALLDDFVSAHPVPSVERDLRYLEQRICEEQASGLIAPQSEIIPVDQRPRPVLGMMEVYYQ